MPQRLPGLVLVALMSSLTPLAHASPPDQHWLGGLYDDADYDDVVLAIADGVAAVELHQPHDSEIDEVTVAVVFPADELVHAAPRHSSNPPRAPPPPSRRHSRPAKALQRPGNLSRPGNRDGETCNAKG